MGCESFQKASKERGVKGLTRVGEEGAGSVLAFCFMHAFSLASDLLHSKHRQHRITAQILHAAYAHRSEISVIVIPRIADFVIEISTSSYTMISSAILIP
jgi:hypothetical protein